MRDAVEEVWILRNEKGANTEKAKRAARHGPIAQLEKRIKSLNWEWAEPMKIITEKKRRIRPA